MIFPGTEVTPSGLQFLRWSSWPFLKMGATFAFLQSAGRRTEWLYLQLLIFNFIQTKPFLYGDKF